MSALPADTSRASTRQAIGFDRATGAIHGANALEAAAAFAFAAGARTSALWNYRGYAVGCAMVRSLLTERNIEVKLNDDALFSFPYGDGYWSLLLDRKFRYESDIEAFFRGIKDADYTLVDCGANYGYWSVLVSSKPFGAHKAIAIEPSSSTFRVLSANAALNGNRFDVLHRAIGEAHGMARLSSAKHESVSIVGDNSGEEVAVIPLDSLIDDGRASTSGRYVIKLDVEGVETAAIAGGQKLLQSDCVLICEEHGNDPNHTVSRFILDNTQLKLFMFDPQTQRFEHLTDVSALDRIKQSVNFGYNVLATASSYWEQRIRALHAPNARADR